MTNGDSPTSPDAAGLMLSLLHQPEAAFSLSSYLRHSRYVTEFEELDVVGEGGFGCVFRARHRLDHKCVFIAKFSTLLWMPKADPWLSFLPASTR